MRSGIQEAKRVLRAQVQSAVRRMAPQERVAGSARARALLEGQPAWQTARSVCFFAPLPEEFDVWPLLARALAAGKRVALPRFVAATRSYEVRWILDPERDLATGHFGIREPSSCCARIASNALDLILVPGVAFDRDGYRLGRGKGYYDQLLGVLRGPTCGVAFEQQIVSAIPVEPHDVRLRFLLTPNEWITVKD